MFSPMGTARNQAGFSLLELLIALVILALIMGLVGPRLIGYLSRAKSQTASAQIENIEGALDLFMLDVGRYPSEQEGLTALVTAPDRLRGWDGPYLDEAELPVDPWGNDYHYVLVANRDKPRVFSLGRDNAEGGDGEDADLG